REWLQFSELFQVRDPAVTDDRANQLGQPRIGLEKPTALSDAVGLVVELFRKQAVQVGEESRFHQFGMDRRNAVDRVAAYSGKIGHPNVLLAGFFDDRNSFDDALVIRASGPDALQKTLIDFVNDLKMPRQDPLHHGDWPFFKSFGE